MWRIYLDDVETYGVGNYVAQGKFLGVSDVSLHVQHCNIATCHEWLQND
jgi:hypothetical protein